MPFDRRTTSCQFNGLSVDTAREHGDTTPYGDSPLATSSFRVYHARRMSNAIIVADSRAVERCLGLHSTRQVGASDALHPIDERAGY